ncbi:MAG: hypothetical protein KGI58_00010 [Patescibacteria group bacterium]|nr:hypothetical protein [Patescibacteria group bacterium]
MEPNQTNTIQENSINNNTVTPGKFKKITLIILGIVVVVSALCYWYSHNKNNTPIQDSRLETLKRLAETSAPVTSTPEERMATLNNLQKSSKPVTTSASDRLSQLQKLSN